MRKKKMDNKDEKWSMCLSPEQFRIMREHGTEAPFTSPLNDEKRGGTFACAACGAALFSSDAKYDSGTGWPSFFKPLETAALGTTTDFKLVYPRTEVHCASCGGHLGHVFNDGPPPTGLRYCINGVALRFAPENK
jgi:peptide-methionine (R)-S-oxide reductase